MHDDMRYDPIQGKGKGHEPLKVGNSVIFNGYLLPHLYSFIRNKCRIKKKKKRKQTEKNTHRNEVKRTKCHGAGK